MVSVASHETGASGKGTIMAAGRSDVSMSFTMEKVDPKVFGTLFKSTRGSQLPVYVELLRPFKVGDTGMFPFTTEEDRKTKESFTRRAAAELGYGIAMKLAPGGKHVAFLIKSRTLRPRKLDQLGPDAVAEALRTVVDEDGDEDEDGYNEDEDEDGE